MANKQNKWDAGTDIYGNPRTKDNAGRNTILNLRYYKDYAYSTPFKNCNVHERIAKKCMYALEGRMAWCMND